MIKNREEILKVHRKELFEKQIWQKIKNEYNANEENIPKFIDVEIKNDVIFKIDRVVWQYLIFSRKIFRKRCVWIDDVFKFIKVNIPMHNDLVKYDSGDRVEEAVNEYIDALVSYGILKLRSMKGAWGKSFIVIKDKLD